MPKAYVGIASPQGLTVLQPERDDTLSLVRRAGLDGGERVGFWAVLGDIDARCVQALVVSGHRREALWLLDRSAREAGRILPGDLTPPLH
ncbi:MAG: hypothetical protein C0501_27725 [Isosphaera sp.]|nr:hypothetical protein [Isosphaera sp.]